LIGIGHNFNGVVVVMQIIIASARCRTDDGIIRRASLVLGSPGK